MMIGGISIDFALQSRGNLATYKLSDLMTLSANVGQKIFVTDAPKVGEVTYNTKGTVLTSNGTGAICVYDGTYWFNTFINQYVPIANQQFNQLSWSTLKSSTSMYSTYVADPSATEDFNSKTGPQSGILLHGDDELTGNFPIPFSNSFFVMEFVEGFNTGGYGGYSVTGAKGPLISLITNNNQKITMTQGTGYHDCYAMPNGYIYNSWNSTNGNGVYSSWLRKAIFKITTTSTGLTVDMTITDDSGNVLLQQLGYQVPGATNIVGYDVGSFYNSFGGKTAYKTIYIFKKLSTDPTSIPYTQLLTMN